MAYKLLCDYGERVPGRDHLHLGERVLSGDSEELPAVHRVVLVHEFGFDALIWVQVDHHLLQ